jgi:glycosyltransferase involved in cell wall biosynthesis
MVSKSKSLLIVIPAYNEEKIIEKTIKEVIKEIKNLNVTTKLLVVNDGSNDNTSIIIKKTIKKSNDVILSNHKTNKGYGAAIQTGIDYANKKKFKYALFMDSDLTNNPKDIKKFADNIKYDYDCVKASRYIKGGKTQNIPLSRLYISKFGNNIASILFNVGVKDCTNGFLMLKPSFFKKIKLKEKDFAVIMEEMYYLKKKNAYIKEIPVTLINRELGKSSFNYKFRTFFDYLKYPIKSLW